jgi:CRISPR type I-E-associated protein CasB/Cse2
VILCLALAAPDRLMGQVRFGAALQEAGFSEKRFVNLLDATPDELRDRLPRAVRFLVSRGGKLYAPQLADLVLTRPNLDDYDNLRQLIAGDYYRAEFKSSQTDEAAA